jgi:hypothetical protein
MDNCLNQAGNYEHYVPQDQGAGGELQIDVSGPEAMVKFPATTAPLSASHAEILSWSTQEQIDKVKVIKLPCQKIWSQNLCSHSRAKWWRNARGYGKLFTASQVPEKKKWYGSGWGSSTNLRLQPKPSTSTGGYGRRHCAKEVIRDRPWWQWYDDDNVGNTGNRANWFDVGGHDEQ